MTTIDRDRVSVDGGVAHSLGGMAAQPNVAQGGGWMQALTDARQTGAADIEDANGASGVSVRLWQSIGDRLALGAVTVRAEAQPVSPAVRLVEAHESPRSMTAPGASDKPAAVYVSSLRRHAAMHAPSATASNMTGLAGMGGPTVSESAGVFANRGAPVRARDPGRGIGANVPYRLDDDPSSLSGVPFPPPASLARLPAALRRVMWRRKSGIDGTRDADCGGPQSDTRATWSIHSSARWLRRVTHAYAGADGITLWLRDGRLEGADLRRIISALNRWASSAGVTLAAVICNGKIVYRNARLEGSACVGGSREPRQSNAID